jgi:hypothetical protein
MKDIIIDTNVIKLYDTPADPRYKELFTWLSERGALAMSMKLLNEWIGTGNRLLAPLVDRLIKEGRHNGISSAQLKAFTSEDKHYNYTCNKKDIDHARLVFLSDRKLLVAGDHKLRKDVNGFRKVSNIQPRAEQHPAPSFYK